MAWTFLRAGYSMQNLTTVHLAEVRDRDEVFVPAGDGRTAFVAVRDLAAVAVLALTGPGHERRAYELTGTSAPTYDEVAAVLTDVLGRRIRDARPGRCGTSGRSCGGGSRRGSRCGRWRSARRRGWGSPRT